MMFYRGKELSEIIVYGITTEYHGMKTTRLSERAENLQRWLDVPDPDRLLSEAECRDRKEIQAYRLVRTNKENEE